MYGGDGVRLWEIKERNTMNGKNEKKKYEWTDVTGSFSEGQRHYKNTYLEIDEVYNMEVEVSLFSAEEGLYEIYVSYGRMYGIVYVAPEKAYALRESIKEDLEKAYDNSREPSSDYINWFVKKYDLQLPMDTLFDFNMEEFF